MADGCPYATPPLSVSGGRAVGPAIQLLLNNNRRPLLLQPPREGGLLRRLGARSRCFCCLDPIPPTEGGGTNNNEHLQDVEPQVRAADAGLKRVSFLQPMKCFLADAPAHVQVVNATVLHVHTGDVVERG